MNLNPYAPEDPTSLAFTEPWEYELAFPRDPRGPGIARTTLRAVLDAHHLLELADRAELLTSELATNSVRHSKGPASVRLRWTHPVLRVSVTDTCPYLPLPSAPPSAEAEDGRGLFILDLVSDEWGGCALGDSLLGPGGKTVWFELVLKPATPPPPPPALAA
ncbi:ATP-binding protein [Streptomyces gilvosporeus]|uniref:ATP-binding protein n=1 Tax=Streptomyces gilvosporeus TaxID=553510 RepID=A0A1V0TVU1_9ACTN|nr:ATP-binding protein [Streptomyces gilvosporeus]ARF57079.1 ATP-binding protein [Streptomyces gilvosporeus]